MTTMTTKTIAGREITLPTGRRYMACRPFAMRGRRHYPVTIREWMPDGFSRLDVLTIDGMTYAEANEFLCEFNSDRWSGREWK